ncbi:MAG: glycosyltransferase family 4 protein, partial [Acinetobacter sp.]
QSWEGECPEVFELILVPIKSRTNHGRNAEYYSWVQAHLLQHPVERVVGFNKMPGLDIYYAADVCYAEKVAQEKSIFYRLTSRYRHYAEFERATFQQGQPTQLLMLTNKQVADFQKHYHTEAERFHILPPGIYPDRKYSQQIPNSRDIYRQKNGISEQQYLLLQVGSDFTRKGVDRSIRALASLPETLRQNTLLFVVGQDKPRKFQTLADKLNVHANVRFFSGRNDVAELMAAADLLMHPAYQEAAGIVLLESIAAGLPVLTTAICGYAHYIRDANCGVVIEEPFQQDILNEVLCRALREPSLCSGWRESARYYADTQDLYSLPEKAADIITGGEDG